MAQKIKELCGYLDTPGLVGEEQPQNQQQSLVRVRDSWYRHEIYQERIYGTEDI